MNSINWTSFLALGILEELFYILTIALLAGRRDILDFKSPGKILRIVAATILTDLCIFFLREYSNDPLFNILVQLAFFSAVYIILLGLEWYESTIGILITFIIYAVFEVISVALIVIFTGVSLNEIKANETMIFYATMPSRVLQIVLIFVLYKLKKPLLNLGRLGKLSTRIFKKLALIHAYLFVAFLQVIFTVKHFIFDQSIENSLNQPFFWLNIFFTVILSSILILVTRMLVRSISFEKQEKIVWLMWFKNLLNQYGYDDKSDIRKTVDDAILKTGSDNREE